MSLTNSEVNLVSPSEIMYQLYPCEQYNLFTNSFHLTFLGTDRYACCGDHEFVCHGSHVGLSSNFGRNVIWNVTRRMERLLHGKTSGQETY